MEAHLNGIILIGLWCYISQLPATIINSLYTIINPQVVIKEKVIVIKNKKIYLKKLTLAKILCWTFRQLLLPSSAKDKKKCKCLTASWWYTMYVNIKSHFERIFWRLNKVSRAFLITSANSLCYCKRLEALYVRL